jgi:hypothetical protein
LFHGVDQRIGVQHGGDLVPVIVWQHGRQLLRNARAGME